MPSVEHRLGELEHVCDKHNLKLKTNGCITFSSFPSSDHAFSSNVQGLDPLIASGTWVTGANRLGFHVELLFDDIAVSGSSLSQATENVGVVLCNAELWSQLGLDASLTIDDSNRFLISLSAHSSSNADVAPQRWTPSTRIETIGMSFHFSACRRTRNASRAPLTVAGSGVRHTLTSTDSIGEHLDRHYLSPLSSPGGPQELPMVRCAPWALRTPSVGTSPASSQGSVSSTAHSTRPFDTPPAPHGYAIQEVQLEILVRMIDFSLRRMMSDHKPVRPGGIVLSSDAGLPKLAAISPGLFSPGYVKAVAQRTTLLPIIARTVARVYRRTNTSGLKHKLRRLQEVSIGNYLDRGSTENSDSSSVMFSSSVEARLWFLTQSKLIDPLACRGLKSLSTSNKPSFGSHEMLDESSEGAEDVMLDGDEAAMFDAYGDVMELDPGYQVDLFQEHSMDGIAEDGENFLDDDLFWDHSQDEIAHDGMEKLDDDTMTHMPGSAGHLHSNLGMMCYAEIQDCVRTGQSTSEMAHPSRSIQDHPYQV